MNNEFSLWRLTIPVNETDQLHDLINRIRPGENKIQRIVPGNSEHIFDLVLTEEELFLMRLGVQSLSYYWLQDWIYARF